ncbi:MAG: 30S ribosomal protein S10 [Candidatus Hodgkinia cicadicola]
MILRIKAKAYSIQPITEYVDRIIMAFRLEHNFVIQGPVYLPTKIVKYTVNKSPHIDKKSRDQLEVRTHNRLIVVKGAYRLIMPKFIEIDLPKGLFVEMKMVLARTRDVRYRSGLLQLPMRRWK